MNNLKDPASIKKAAWQKREAELDQLNNEYFAAGSVISEDLEKRITAAWDDCKAEIALGLSQL